jgi:hypothetical protein
MATAASNMATTTPAAAATPNNTTTTTPSAIELSPEPVHQEQQTLVSEIPINETHNQFTFSGNGNLNLPNGTINITSTGSVIALMDGTAVGEEVLTTEDGTESATATFYAIGRFNMEDGSGKSILIALVHTNSTGQLAPLNGAIVAGEIEFLPDQTSLVTLWEWQSGIPLPTTDTASNTTMDESSPLSPMNTTSTTTTANATAASDTNTTGTASEEQGEGEQQQCQLELMTNEETFGLGDSVTLTVTNVGDEDLVFSNSILGLEIENQNTGEAYPLFSAQAIITLRPGESRTSELSYEVLVSEIGTGIIEASVSSDEGCLASTTFTLA